MNEIAFINLIWLISLSSNFLLSFFHSYNQVTCFNFNFNFNISTHYICSTTKVNNQSTTPQFQTSIIVSKLMWNLINYLPPNNTRTIECWMDSLYSSVLHALLTKHKIIQWTKNHSSSISLTFNATNKSNKEVTEYCTKCFKSMVQWL